MNIKQIVPKEVKCKIPVMFYDEQGEFVQDYITVFTPDNNRVVNMYEDMKNEKSESSIDILKILIKNFTDLTGLDEFDGMAEFQTYFDEPWTQLQDELYRIYGTIIKEGISTRERILAITEQEIDAVSMVDSELAGNITKIKSVFEKHMDDRKGKVGA